MPDVPHRFMSKVDTSGDCWLWTGYAAADGYGRFSVGGRAGRRVLAHRWSYEHFVGPIPDGMTIDHQCLVRRCVNPHHLRPVTHKQNQENRSGAQANSRSGVRGVSWCPNTHSWVATVQHNGTRHRVGLFKTIEDAAAEVVRMRNELFTHNDLDRRKRA